MSEIFEILMVVSFGASWPLNVIKSWKARTTKGKSLMFLLLILFGYVAGIISKLVNEAYMADFASKWYVLFFYIIADCAVILSFFIYNRGFVDKDATLDNLPDTMTIEEKQDYIDSIALRKKKSRWMPIMIIILSVPLMLDTLNIFVIEGLFGWKIF